MPEPLLWKGFQEQCKCNNFAYLQENNTLLSWHIQEAMIEFWDFANWETHSRE